MNHSIVLIDRVPCRMQVSSDTVLISEMQSLLRAVQQRMSTIEEKVGYFLQY